MGALVGLVFGAGAVLILLSVTSAPAPRGRARGGLRRRTAELLAGAGVTGVTPGGLLAVCAGLGLVTTVAGAGLSRVPAIGLAFGLFAASAPVAALRGRRRRRVAELRAVWPELVDNLASAVRAGLSLPEALAALGERGPAPVRPAFAAFAADYRSTGRFAECTERLGDALADPVADRVLEALRLAREVGGTELGRLLRTLSAFLRDDARARAELEARQGWTVNAARLALAAPWLLLLLLSSRPAAVEAYRTSAGALVLAVGGGVSLLAYRLMLRVARLPTERRLPR